MAYQRFLTNYDYKAVVTDEQFSQLVNNVEYRLSQAEQSAEMNFLEYLDQYYEIEKVLRVGKSIRAYNANVTYPAQVFFKKDEIIYKTMTSINGCKKPYTTTYWEQIEDLYSYRDLDRKPKYSQLATYGIGDIVKFGTEYWECKAPNGYDLDNIILPGINAWQTVTTKAWEPNLTWEENDVCSYNGKFYTKISVPETEDPTTTPETDDTWGLIGDYSSDYNYDYSEDNTDYVVFDDTVFRPKINPNADAVTEGTNIVREDPRNLNVVTHMTRLAVYYLHQIISPTNISETRRLMYEDSMLWLSNASKFKINPKIPRRKDREDGQDMVDWACETFQRQYNPYENPWLI